VIAGAVATLGFSSGAPVAGAATATGPASPLEILLPASAAAAAGYPTLVDGPAVTNQTGVKGCPEAEHEAFTPSSGTGSLSSEAYFCQSSSATTNLLKGLRGGGSPVKGLTAPKALGSSAIELRGTNHNFGVFWRRGTTVELTVLAPGSQPTSSLSALQQGVLTQAALTQDAAFTSTQNSPTISEQTQANAVASKAGCPKSPLTLLSKPTWSKAPAMGIDTSKNYSALVETDLGTFAIQLFANVAPKTVNSFVFLAQRDFFNCVTFHRVIPGFVDQTGDPTGTGTGGPGYKIPDELPPATSDPNAQYPLGGVAMANSGSPNTGGSQWFIVAGAEAEALPPSYSLFGEVSSGMDVVQRINAQGSTSGSPPAVVHRILRVTISSG
jgi:peptidylprolyl isomerase/peptidyl-prolyl cis-trans isomerase B (cyclophilin B)